MKGIDLVDAGAEAMYRVSAQLDETDEKWVRELEAKSELKRAELEAETSNK